MTKSPLTRTDATYKLLWQGYPVLIVGTADANHVFHPFAVAVIKGETEKDFAFIFEALHEADLEWTQWLQDCIFSSFYSSDVFFLGEEED